MTTQEPAGQESAWPEPRPRELIVTLFGLYARAERNWLSVATLVKLMAEVGVDGPSVRSSISRLKRKGVLESHKHGSAAGYSLSDATLEVLAEGDVRIFERKRAKPEDGWLLVVFSVPESERDKRHALRSTLTRLGFGTAAPGVWIAPGNLARETRETIERRELSCYVDVFTAEHFAFGDLRAKVRSWWDLDELTRLYADFIERYRTVCSNAASMEPRAALRAYVPMLTRWRRLPYLDPGLPLSLLPQGWNGVTAGELFDELNRGLAGPAREYANAVIQHG